MKKLLILSLCFLIAFAIGLVVCNYYVKQNEWIPGKDTKQQLTFCYSKYLKVTTNSSLTLQDENFEIYIHRILFTQSTNPTRKGGSMCAGSKEAEKTKPRSIGMLDGVEIYAAGTYYSLDKQMCNGYTESLRIHGYEFPLYDRFTIQAMPKSNLSEVEFSRYYEIANKIVLSLKDTNASPQWKMAQDPIQKIIFRHPPQLPFKTNNGARTFQDKNVKLILKRIPFAQKEQVYSSGEITCVDPTKQNLVDGGILNIRPLLREGDFDTGAIYYYDNGDATSLPANIDGMPAKGPILRALIPFYSKHYKSYDFVTASLTFTNTQLSSVQRAEYLHIADSIATSLSDTQGNEYMLSAFG